MPAGRFGVVMMAKLAQRRAAVKIYALIAAMGILFAACGQSYVVNAEISPQVADPQAADFIAAAQSDIEYDEQEQKADLSGIDSLGEMHILWDDGNIQYGSRIEGNNRVLYAIENGGLDLTQLAVFQPLLVEWGHDETEWCNPQSIFYFEVIGDWLIASVGEIQGSGRYFYGDIYRIRRDGGGRESFGLGSFNHRFFIIDGWVYHRYWCFHPTREEGFYRFRPDGSDMEFLGDAIYSIFLIGEDGYIYGIHAASGRGNLARWKPDSTEPITLFLGETAPSFEEYNSSMGYWNNITVMNEYVIFTVIVSGYRDSQFRESFLYTAEYRVDKDGSNLTLLSEKYH